MGEELEEANRTGRWPKWVVALPGTLDNLKAWHRLVASSGFITVPLLWRGCGDGSWTPKTLSLWWESQCRLRAGTLYSYRSLETAHPLGSSA